MAEHKYTMNAMQILVGCVVVSSDSIPFDSLFITIFLSHTKRILRNKNDEETNNIIYCKGCV